MLNEISSTIRTLVEAIKASYSQPLTIVYDNREVDSVRQTQPYLEVQIKPIFGETASLYSRYELDVLGEIRLTAKVKKGVGVAKAYDILDFFFPKMQGRSLGRIHLQGSSFARPTEQLGWYEVTVIIPFRTIKTFNP